MLPVRVSPYTLVNFVILPRLVFLESHWLLTSLELMHSGHTACPTRDRTLGHQIRVRSLIGGRCARINHNHEFLYLMAYGAAIGIGRRVALSNLGCF